MISAPPGLKLAQTLFAVVDVVEVFFALVVFGLVLEDVVCFPTVNLRLPSTIVAAFMFVVAFWLVVLVVLVGHPSATSAS